MVREIRKTLGNPAKLTTMSMADRAMLDDTLNWLTTGSSKMQSLVSRSTRAELMGDLEELGLERVNGRHVLVEELADLRLGQPGPNH